MSMEEEIKEMKQDFRDHQESDKNFFQGFNSDLKNIKEDISTITSEKYVKWYIFAWVVGVVTIMIGGAFAMAQNTSVQVGSNTIDVRVLQTQYTNIDKNITEIKDLIKK